MSSFPIDDGQTLVCDIPTLLNSKLLIQANSGGGKSYAVRRLLEQTHGHVQQIVLDPEGEFASLREKYDYVYVARVDGDAVAHPRSAALLAERLLELGVSAIIDLFELHPNDRVRFVRLFLEAMVNAPKKLWHPVLVVLDEAHMYAPEKGQAESASAVIGLCSLGRKRGFCAVLATQRIQKLSKDAAAECNNKMIGRTTLDIDMSRAGEELGFPKARLRELKDLDPGQFFVEGPAFNRRGVVEVKVGRVVTTHPEAGKRHRYVAPPPTSKIRALLPKLGDLPAEAEERAKTTEELRAEIAKLRRELSEAKAAAGRPTTPAIRRSLQPLIHRLSTLVNTTNAALSGLHQDLVRSVDELEKKLDNGLPQGPVPGSPRARENLPRELPRPSARATPSSSSKLPEGERAILTAVAQHTDGVDMEQLTVLTGYKKSTRNTYVQRLRQSGFIGVENGLIVVSAEGMVALGDNFEPLPTGEALREHWLRTLPEGESKIFDLLTGVYPGGMTRVRIEQATGYKKSTSNTYIQRLTQRKLVVATRDQIVASNKLF